MKSYEDIVNQEPVFMNDWSHRVDTIGDFEDVYMNNAEYEADESPYANVDYWIENKNNMKLAIERYKDINILFASYSAANYTGDAWVLFEQNGQLFEVNGSHCSCYGLEGQWEPEETNLEVLEHRLLNGTFGEDDWSDNNFKQELCEFLGVEFKINYKK